VTRTLDEFLEDPDYTGETVKTAWDISAWVCFFGPPMSPGNPNHTVQLDGEFTTYELIKIIAAFNRDKQVAK
jgi:hypothetical protein